MVITVTTQPTGRVLYLHLSHKRLIALGVTIFAPMTAAGIDIDAIAVAAWEVFLVGKRAIPFDNARPCNAKDLFFRCVRQKIPRQSRLLFGAEFIKEFYFFKLKLLIYT